MECEKTIEELIEAVELKIKDAEENLGDVEVRDFLIEKAEIYLKHNNKEKCIETYKLALAKSVGVGKKMDVHFFILKIYFEERNLEKIIEHIELQKTLLDAGGDWERKNRLKVYEGIYSLLVRNIQQASNLLLDSVSTFQATEIISFAELVQYAVFTSIITLDRQTLKKKVLQNPEVISLLRENETLRLFLESFIQCDYKTLFQKFYLILQTLQNDQYLSQHRKYVAREFRIVFYQQFLESYKTVTLNNMALAFGVSAEFIDRELSDLISSRRIHCKIDKVSGIVESQRTDDRNQLYQNALKQGDHLLNRVQKLSRLTDL